MSGRFIDVDQPQTNQPSEVTFADILAAINKDRGIVPDGYRAVPAAEPQRRSQRQQGGAGESIDDLVQATLNSLIDKVASLKAETDQTQKGIKVALTSIVGNMKEMNVEHKRFNQRFQDLEVAIERINGFIASVRVDPPPPPPPQPIPPQLQPPPPQQQYAPASAPPYQPQAYWPYNPR